MTIGRKEVLRETSAPMPFCAPQIPHGVPGDETRASTVRRRWRTLGLWLGCAAERYRPVEQCLFAT
jgi:hypothetical protein